MQMSTLHVSRLRDLLGAGVLAKALNKCDRVNRGKREGRVRRGEAARTQHCPPSMSTGSGTSSEQAYLQT